MLSVTYALVPITGMWMHVTVSRQSIGLALVGRAGVGVGGGVGRQALCRSPFPSVASVRSVLPSAPTSAPHVSIPARALCVPAHSVRSSSMASPAPAASTPVMECRLPTNVRPTHYHVTLRPDLPAATFSGHLLVDVDVVEASTRVQLNAVELQVQTAELLLPGQCIAAATIALSDKEEVLTLTFSDTIPVGKAQLRLHYTGTLNDQMRGFYLSKYTDEQGAEQRLATTQFEATGTSRTHAHVYSDS